MSLQELLATTKGKVTVAAELFALVAMGPFLLIEGSTMVAYLKVLVLKQLAFSSFCVVVYTSSSGLAQCVELAWCVGLV